MKKQLKVKLKIERMLEKKAIKLADGIRKDLESNGVIIEDKGDKTTWKYK